MGAWGPEFDANDDAADWLADLAGAPSWQIVETALTLRWVLYLGAPRASVAVAAAEIVAAGLHHPSPKLNSRLADWARGGGMPAHLRGKALKTIERVRRRSELASLWRQDPDQAWGQAIAELHSRLVA